MKPAVLDSFKAKLQTWKDIDLSKDNKLISTRKLDLGFVIDEDISKFKKSHPTKPNKKYSKFRSEAKLFIVAMVSKLSERRPCGSALLKSASVLYPDVLQSSTGDKLITSLKHCSKSANLSVLAVKS